EGVSCLVTEEVGGTDLERYLERRAPQVPRTRAFDELLGDAVRDLLVRLVDEGIDFEDLVPKHLFLDRAGDGVSITLIDAFRLRRRRGAANLMAKSLSRLACHLSVFAVSSAERMRFVVSLVGREHARALFAQAQRESGKLLLRRSARRNLSRHARGVDPCRRSNAAGDLVFDPDRREEIDALGLDPEDARGSRQTLGRERLPLRFELVTGSIQDLRDLFTVHHVLRGFCHLPGLLMRHFGSGADDEGFLIFDRLGGETLSESLSSADPDRLQRIAAALDEALVQLLFMGIRPTASFCEWFVVQGSRVLVQPRLPFEFRYVDGKDDLKRIRARIDAELDGGGVSLPRREKVRAALRFVRPGLLGHEEPLA
ncbi:MAG: hypothetical protein KDB53_21975, partial [Planctomycetes bacterium]|nr:hypothetical protein [Planctomycetota bacterium]